MSVLRLLRPGRSVLAGMAGSAITLALVAGVMMATGTGFADGATIYGCVKNGSGLLRIVGGPGSCGVAETPLQWADGAAPSAFSVTRRTETGVIPPHDHRAVFSLCRDGEVATGGGYFLGDLAGGDPSGDATLDGTVTRSMPGIFRSHVDPNGVVYGWGVRVQNAGEQPLDLWVTALCAPGTGSS